VKLVQLLILVLLSNLSFAGTSDKFESFTVGFEVTKPTEWQFITAEENLENIKKVKLSDEEFHQKMLKYSTAPLVAMMKYSEPYDDLNPSFKVNIKPLGQLKGSDPKKILSLILPQFQKIFQDLSLAQPPTDTKVSGLNAAYMSINYSLAIPDGRVFPTTSEVWIVPRGDFFFIIGAGTRQDEKTGSRKDIQAILNTVVLSQ